MHEYINLFRNHHEMDHLMVVDMIDLHQMSRKFVVKVKMIISYSKEKWTCLINYYLIHFDVGLIY
jgi:hypothetical protein